jgi:hypothetical protein
VSASDVSIRISAEKGRIGEKRLFSWPRAEIHDSADPHPADLIVRVAEHQRLLQSEFIFATNGRRWSYGDYRALYAGALRKAGVSAVAGRLLPHSARSGGASAAIRLGVPELLVQQLGGWRSRDSMLAYVVAVQHHPAAYYYFGHLLPMSSI